MPASTRAQAIIGVIASSFFDYQDPNGDKCDPSFPPGKDLADFIIRRLLLGGAERPTRTFAGEGGWTFDIEIAGNVYLVFVLWAPIGPQHADRWVIQTDIHKSIFRVFFGRRTSDEEVVPIVEALQRALDGAPEIETVEWITRERFDQIY
jgi:hypothetical protein